MARKRYRQRLDGLSVDRRRCSGRRTTISNRRSPSNTCPACLPPTAISTIVLHVGDADAVARECRPVELHRQHGQAGHLLGLHVGGARNGLQHRLHCPRLASSVSRSSPKILTPTSLRTPEISSLNRNLDRLARARSCCPGMSSAAVLDFRDQVGLGLFGIRPLRPRLEHDVAVGDRRRHRIGGDFGRSRSWRTPP